MSHARFGAILGLALGAIWAFRGILWALLAAALALVGFLIGLVLSGRVDVAKYLPETDRSSN